MWLHTSFLRRGSLCRKRGRFSRRKVSRAISAFCAFAIFCGDRIGIRVIGGFKTRVRAGKRSGTGSEAISRSVIATRAGDDANCAPSLGNFAPQSTRNKDAKRRASGPVSVPKIRVFGPRCDSLVPPLFACPRT